MTPAQAFALAQKAKTAGYALAIKAGKVQLQTVSFDTSGVSTVTPRSDWLTHTEALAKLEGKA